MCVPPPRCPDPGTVDVPQDTPPPHWPAGPKTAGDDPARPPKNSPGEMGWFHGKVQKIIRDGPQFGPRKDEFLPLLVVRAAAGDNGSRPWNGVFWESPDIFVLPGVEWAAAPLLPKAFGAVAKAAAPNTVYAHLWNLGRAPGYRVRVEFYWFNPTLGISLADANLIGATWVDLGNRFSHSDDWKEARSCGIPYVTKGSHVIVRCPVTWVPEFVNNGHECLVVRVSEPLMDAVAPDEFSAPADRHVGQRNIAVVLSGSPAHIDMALDLGFQAQAGTADVEVEQVDANSMDWLKLYAGSRTASFQAPTQPVIAGLLPATLRGSRTLDVSSLPADQRGVLLRQHETVQLDCAPLSMQLHASIANMKPGEANVLRVRQRVANRLVGGYTVVLLGR